MKLRITAGNAWALGLAALAMRLFTGIAIDRPDLHISGWMCALIGAGLCQPAACAADIISRALPERSPAAELERALGRAPVRLIELMFLIVLLLDAAGVFAINALLADYVTMTNLRAAYVQVPLAAALLFALLSNGDGVGGAARLWLWLVPVLFLLIVCQHFSSYRFRWLVPAWGGGPGKILSGGLAAAGWLAPSLILWLLAEPDDVRLARRRRLSSLLLIAGGSAALLLVLHYAITPVQVRGTASRVFQIDSLISNGRASIVTQLPMIVVWFVGFFEICALDLFLAALLIEHLFPRLDGRICALVVCLAAGVSGAGGWVQREALLTLANWAYLIVAVPFTLAAAVLFFRQRKGLDRA